MNLAELMAQGSHLLQSSHVALGQGTLEMADEAAWLVLWRLGLPLDTDPQMHSDHLSEAQIQSCLALLQQRIDQRLPSAYLTREAWLQGVDFYVDERSIVPRSLIAEVLALQSIDLFLSPAPHSILDLCTGNGSLAVLAAMAYPDALIEGSDISTDALAVARINGERHGLSHRIEWRAVAGLAPPLGQYDLILCNPPYVNEHSMQQLPPEFLAEPRLALAGGRDGMDFIRPLLAGAHQHLSPHGVLVLEIGHERDHFDAAFPWLSPIGLSTSAGDDQVLLLDQQQLKQAPC
jgi:ribosomal protein L3 glutamine methyltransferase